MVHQHGSCQHRPGQQMQERHRALLPMARFTAFELPSTTSQPVTTQADTHTTHRLRPVSSPGSRRPDLLAATFGKATSNCLQCPHWLLIYPNQLGGSYLPSQIAAVDTSVLQHSFLVYEREFTTVRKDTFEKEISVLFHCQHLLAPRHRGYDNKRPLR